MANCHRNQNASTRSFLAAAALICATATTPAVADETAWAALAGYWAPVVAQSTQYGTDLDVITAVDYDGDWNMANNGSSKGHGLPSVVYYWVTESAGYYYIGYALYHVAGVIAGEEDSIRFASDMQGVVLAIRKIEGQPLGQFVALRTWGTDQPFFYTEQSSGLSAEAGAWLAQNVSEKTPVNDGVGDIDFVIDSLGFHPVIYSRAAHHVVVGEKDQAEFPEGPPVFEAQDIVDWRWIQTIVDGGAPELRNRYHRPGSGNISGGDGNVPGDDGLLYRYEGQSMEVVQANSKGRGTLLHHWNLVAYDLEPISGLWQRRLDFQNGQGETFAGYGVFAGEGDPGPSARAPWGWGAIFFDPAAAFAVILPEASDDGAGAILGASFEEPETLAGEYAARTTP